MPLNLRATLAARLRAVADRLAPDSATPPARQTVCPKLLEFEQEHQKWLDAKGDKTLRLDYPLSADSVVLDIGGFEGQWASDIYAKYLCSIHVFEAIPSYAEFIRARFGLNPKIHVHPFGLAASDRTEVFKLAGDASSSFNRGHSEGVEVKLVNATRILSQLGITDAALAKVNIEGAEYELLEHFADTGFIRRIHDLQIQFHNFVTDAESKLQKVHNLLSRTHVPTYQYRFIWENWRLKN